MYDPNQWGAPPAEPEPEPEAPALDNGTPLFDTRTGNLLGVVVNVNGAPYMAPLNPIPENVAPATEQEGE